MEHTQTRLQKLSSGMFADLMPRCRLVGYESSWRSGSLAALATIKPNSSLPPALQDNYFKSCKFSLVAFLRSALVPEEHQASLLFRSKK